MLNEVAAETGRNRGATTSSPGSVFVALPFGNEAVDEAVPVPFAELAVNVVPSVLLHCRTAPGIYNPPQRSRYG